MSDEHLNKMSDEQLAYLLNFVARPILGKLRERGCDVEPVAHSAPSAIVFRVSRNGREIVGSR